MTKGFISGVWDLCHTGHILAFKECKEHCDYIVVALNIDPTIERPFKNKPIESVEERMIRLEGCKYVDEIVVYNSEKQCLDFIESMNIDVRFLGDDYKDKKFEGCELPIKHIFINRDHGYSSSSLRKRCSQ